MSTSFGVPLYSGTFPSKYLLTIDTVLFTKFPKSLHKSELYLSIKLSGVYNPSCDVCISLNKKYLVASTPYLLINFSGYTTFPFDFDIFPSFIIIKLWTNIFFGNGKSNAIKNIGQYIKWNLAISFPTICKSAGHNFLYNESSSCLYPNAVT